MSWDIQRYPWTVSLTFREFYPCFCLLPLAFSLSSCHPLPLAYSSYFPTSLSPCNTKSTKPFAHAISFPNIPSDKMRYSYRWSYLFSPHCLAPFFFLATPVEKHCRSPLPLYDVSWKLNRGHLDIGKPKLACPKNYFRTPCLRPWPVFPPCQVSKSTDCRSTVGTICFV